MKGKGSKHGKKRKTAKLKATAPSASFMSEHLPDAIYRKSYDKLNRHLPVAVYESDYDALLFLTAARDDLNGVRALLNTGRKVDMVDAQGETPLMVAVRHNAINTSRLLLALGANPDMADQTGATPRQIAMQSSNGWMQQAFINSGRDKLQASK